MTQSLTKKRPHSIGFTHALDGIKYAISSQPNFRIHLMISSLVILAILYFPINNLQIIILIFCILLGLIVEMINTTVEAVVDLVTQEWRQSAKIAKDVAAGTMLLTAIGTSIIAILIFYPHLIALFAI